MRISGYASQSLLLQELFEVTGLRTFDPFTRFLKMMIIRPFRYAVPLARCLSSTVGAPAVSTFKASNLDLRYNILRKGLPNPDNLLFGHSMTDHMFQVHWRADRGWGTPAITEYKPFQMDPASKCLHYAIQIFEGMKAYRGDDNEVRLFRPDANFERMNNSAGRLCLPMFDSSEMTKCLHRLVDTERDWVFKKEGYSLYIRPTMIGTENSIGVSKSTEALLYVICCPVGPYFPHGMKPVSLLADPSFVRAWPGGGGDSKLGSNYGPTILIQEKAHDEGCQQVLWLYGQDRQLTEAGTMNVFVHLINEQGENELVTPSLSAQVILPGVVRRSAIELVKTWGDIKVSERKITMDEVIKANEQGRLVEMFGSGTACVVCPIERIHYEGKDIIVSTDTSKGAIYKRLYDELNDVYYGRKQFSNWTEVVKHYQQS